MDRNLTKGPNEDLNFKRIILWGCNGLDFRRMILMDRNLTKGPNQGLEFKQIL